MSDYLLTTTWEMRCCETPHKPNETKVVIDRITGQSLNRLQLEINLTISLRKQKKEDGFVFEKVISASLAPLLSDIKEE